LYVKLQGKDNQHYIIVSGCHVGKNQNINFGLNNTYNQQYHLLHQQGHQSPKPRNQFVDNIIQLINTWRNNHKAVLLCIDANENPQKPSTTRIYHIFTKANLLDLHSHQHPGQCRPSMYNWGTNHIELCAGSIEFTNALEAAWYSPFGEPAGLKRDH